MGTAMRVKQGRKYNIYFNEALVEEFREKMLKGSDMSLSKALSEAMHIMLGHETITGRLAEFEEILKQSKKKRK